MLDASFSRLFSSNFIFHMSLLNSKFIFFMCVVEIIFGGKI